MTDAEKAELHGYRQQAVLKTMRLISEEHFCSGWQMGIERRLWRMCFEGETRCFWSGKVDEMTLMSLKQNAESCDTWWHWPAGAGEEQPITLAEAQRLYGSGGA